MFSCASLLLFIFSIDCFIVKFLIFVIISATYTIFRSRSHERSRDRGGERRYRD